MEPFHTYIPEYRKQLEKGAIQKAYQGIMAYILGLKNHFKNQHPDFLVSGSLYTGYMDMTYFAVVPPAFKPLGLKVAVVFLHDAFRFEAWLSAVNKGVQEKYWEQLKTVNDQPYRLVPSVQGVDSILETNLADEPDFVDLDALTRKIEVDTIAFITSLKNLLEI